jgi:hypothetical protein
MKLSSEARQVPVPPYVVEASSLGRVDYADAFVVQTGPTADRSAEEWARALLEGAPSPLRATLVRSWTLLGLKIGSTRDVDRVLGWQVACSTPDQVLLHADSRIGLPGELLIERRSESVLLSTLLRQDNLVARLLWAAITPSHQRVARHVAGLVTRPTGAPA